MGFARGAGVAVGMLLALPLLAGCPCEPNVVFAEDFEHCDASCGWQVELGSVELDETIHSSQHALRLTPGTTITRTIGLVHDDPYPVNASLVTD